MAEKQWYVLVFDKETGPFSSNQLRQMATQRRIDPETQVRLDNSVWFRAGKVSGLSFPKAIEAPKVIENKVVTPERQNQLISDWVGTAVNADPKTKCPFCLEQVERDAVKCKHCHEFLDSRLRQSASHALPSMRFHAPQKQWNPGVAAVLSFVIPGAGQMYKGQVGNGIACFIVVLIGYAMLIIPGLLLHLFCVVDASRGDPYA